MILKGINFMGQRIMMDHDYMTPLPVEKRQTHAPVSSFDFNVKSKNVKEKMQNSKWICENTANTETGNSHTILISPIGF